MAQLTKLGLLGLLFMASLSWGQECSHLWLPSLELNPDGPKTMSGDSYAVYGLAGFKNKRNLKLIIKGDFFKGRFMSFESYKTKQKLSVHQLYDRDMVADEGSENPFIDGNAIDTPNRSYTVEVIKEGQRPTHKNVLYLDKRTRVHSIFYRAYVPSKLKEVKLKDLPKIYAYDSRTGQPTSCPRKVDTLYDPGIITVILKFIEKKTVLPFDHGDFWNGTNHAIPDYVYALSKKDHGDVTMARFKAATFTKTESGTGQFIDDGQVRYWSFCIQNLKESLTLGCIPDFLSKPDANGFVTVVVGPESVRKLAEERGFNFLLDKRGPEQKVLGYFLRDLFPVAGFDPYAGDYLPVGRICSKQEFVSGLCETNLEN